EGSVQPGRRGGRQLLDRRGEGQVHHAGLHGAAAGTAPSTRRLRGLALGGGGDHPWLLVRHSGHHVRGAKAMPTQRSTRERAPAPSNGRRASDSPGDVEVRRGVAELAACLGDRLPEVVAAISASLRDEIPDLTDEAQLPLLDASVEGNVTTALYALGHDT